MAHVLLLMLTCMVAASGASYIDYGVKMPQYGGSADYDMGRDPPPSQPSDDYRGHSPDASASLDYKYEEEPRVKTEKPAKDADELEGWRKPGRKQRELVRPLKSNASIRNKYDHDDDEIPKFRTNRRYSNHRPRLKTEIDQTEEETPFRRHNKYSRDRKDDISELDRKDYLHIDKDYVPDDKNKEFDDDVKFMREITTKRPNRRRPREREFKRDDILSDYVEDALPEAPKSDSDSEKEPPRGDFRRFRPSEDRIAPDRIAPDRIAPTRIAPDRTRYRSSNEEEEEIRDEAMKPGPGKFKAKGYDEYDDYYDMKRVHNIKNKLPSLPRRTTDSEVHSTEASVAERELKAALGAIVAHRQRKEVTPEPVLPSPLNLFSAPTFEPQAVPPSVNENWRYFIATNHTKRLQISMYLTLLVLIINRLQRYDYRDIIANYISYSGFKLFSLETLELCLMEVKTLVHLACQMPLIDVI